MATFRSLGSSSGLDWQAIHGDCVDVVRQMPEKSIDLSVYSPPFSGLYIYNDSVADMGNSVNDEEFITHYRHFAKELFRVIKPGRKVYVHCKDLVFYRTQTGFDAGLRDLPGMLIAAHLEAGFTFHSRITIWRCPVMEMTKTKAHGLLYKTLRADSTQSRQGLPEYFLVFRRWPREGEETVPVTHTKGSFPLDQWQEWASPVWMTTRVTDVIHGKKAPGDERHICPMPLDLTRRAVIMDSNPGDVVLSPFMGIGSEGVAALSQDRRFVGVELKQSYFKQASKHLDIAEQEAGSRLPGLVA